MADAPHTEGPGLGQPPGQQAKHMTWSRRFVQRLGAYEWYNPNRYYAGGRCNPRDDGSAYHMYANDGAKEGPTTEPSLDAAWSYYEHVTLPNTNNMLYPVWKTSLSDLVQFGVSNQMYFSTLLVFSGILFLAGVLNIPLMVYFWNYANTAENDKSEISYMTIGKSIRASALCDATEWVWCPTCYEHVSEYPAYRMQTYDGNGEVSYLVRRNVCNFVDFLTPGILSYIASMLLLALGAFFLLKQRRAEIVIDESIQTASDYSINILNPPADATDPEEWKRFFDQFVDANDNREVEVVESVEVNRFDRDPRSRNLTHKRHGGVALVTVAINNGELIKALIKRRQKVDALRKMLSKISYQLGTEQAAVNSLTTMDLIESTVKEASSAIRSNSSCLYLALMGLLSPVDPIFLWEDIVEIEDSIRTLIEQKQFSAVSVFVTFDSERSQRNALHALSTGKLNVWRNERARNKQSNIQRGGLLRVKESAQSSSLWSLGEAMEQEKTIQLSIPPTPSDASLGQCLLFRGERVLSVFEADEPSDVRWVDLQSSTFQRFESHFLSALGMVLFISWSGYVIYKLTTNYPGPYAAMFITLTNAIVPMICEIVSDMESHSREHSRQLSLYVKITLFRWFNSAVAVSMASTFIETISIEDGAELLPSSLVVKVYPVIVAELFMNPLIELLDFGGTFQKHFLATRTNSQEDMNACFTGTRWWLAERYTNANRVLFVALFFSSILPESLFLGSLALLAQYHVGKYALLRLCGPTADVGFHLARVSRRLFFPAILLTHVVMSAFWWSGYPYDQVCDGDDGYEYCNQDFWKSRVFPPLPRFQPDGTKWMSESQATLTSLYGYTSVFVLIIAVSKYLEANVIPWIRGLYQSTYEPDGMDQNIPFSSVIHKKEIHGYIPQVKVPGMPFPLLACDIEGIDKDLIGWSDSRVGYEPHNLLRDVEALLKHKPLHPVFSVVREWRQ